jgi:dTDP-4-dehydrorhamnose 3,5-epimerase
MIFLHTDIPDLILIEPKVFADERGYFFESFSEEKFSAFVKEQISFVQDNESKSNKNVVRGLHFQAPPYSQAKLVRVVKGSVLDVAVDIRKSSPTYGKSYSVILSEENKKQLYIPAGFLHGFSTLEDNTIFSYKCSNYYHPESEGSVLWNDSTLNIDWLTEDSIISEKDKKGVPFVEFTSPFE